MTARTNATVKVSNVKGTVMIGGGSLLKPAIRKATGEGYSNPA
jgi:hypothetical protein